MKDEMSSIGRTRYTSSKLFTWCVGLTALTSATIYASKTLEEITKHGAISVNTAQFSALLSTTFHSAQIEDAEVFIAENKIVEQIDAAAAQLLPTPPALVVKRLAKVKVFKAAPTVVMAREAVPEIILEKSATNVATASTEESTPPLIDSVKLTQSVGLDEVPTTPVPTEPKQDPAPAILGSLLSLPTAEEEKAIQDIHAALRNRFYVAIQKVELDIHPLKIADIAIEPVPEPELSAPSESTEAQSVQAYIDQGATVIEEEVGPPAFEKALETTTVSAPPEEVEEELAPAVAVAVAAAPVQPSLLKTTTLDEIPEPDIQPVSDTLAKVSPVIEKELNTQISAPLTHTRILSLPSTSLLDGIPEPETIAHAPPPTREKIIAVPAIIAIAAAVPLKTTAKIVAPTEDELTSYEEDIHSALITHDEEEDEYPVVTRQASPRRASTASRLPVVSTSKKPSLLDATTQRKTPSVAGVDQDANGITIAWSKSGATSAGKMIASTSTGISVNDASALPEIKKTCDTALVGRGAFLPITSETLSVCRRALSLEGTAGGTQSRWWEVKEEAGSWSTLIWQDPKAAFTRENRIPILANNTVKLLSMIARSDVQATAGLVYGEVPAGLEVQLSGRSEQVIFFDQNLKTIDARDVTRTRFFAFLNVAPGNPLLFVSLRGGTKGGAVPLLVKAGQATYIRVPLPQLKSIQATVFDAGARAAQGMASLSVQVVGQDGKTAVTDTKGSFEIRDVVVFGDYATYVDVAPNEKSFKHRYRLRATELKGKSLFYFRDQAVSHWMTQLEGGVSPFSGLIVGAVPSVANEKNASIRIGSLAKKDSLTPEAYVLGVGDSLIDHQKLGNGNIRFVGVQIPEGPHFPAAFGKNGEMLWSELVISQPGVINVVGP